MRFHQKRVILVFCVCIFFTLTACTQHESSDRHNRIMSYFNSQVLTKDWKGTSEIWSDLGFGEISGLVSDNSYIYMVDKKNNHILKLSKDGLSKKEYGSIGNEPGELMEPSAICLLDNKIAVAESGNHRIQMFDKDGLSQYIISLPLTDAFVNYRDIEITEDGFLLSVYQPMQKEKSGVYSVSFNGETVQQLSCILGKFSKINNEIFFMQEFEYFKEGNEEGFQTGEGGIWKWNGISFDKQNAQLPFGYGIAGASSYNGQILTCSAGFANIDVFSSDWRYEYSLIPLLNIEGINMNQMVGALFTSDLDSHIYLALPGNGNIIKIDLNE